MSIKDIIQEKIQSHAVKMKPKIYFTFGAILLGLGAAFALLAGIFFTAVIRFRLRVNAPFNYLNSPKGLTPFIENIPWVPVVIAITGIVVGVLLMRKFEFSYKHAFVGIAAGFFIAVVALGIVLDAAGLPERAERIEALRPMLHMRYDNDTWVAGTAIEPCEPDCVIETPAGDLFTIYVLPSTEIIPDNPIRIGEWLRIIGEHDKDAWQADIIMHQPSPRMHPRATPFGMPIR